MGIRSTLGNAKNAVTQKLTNAKNFATDGLHRLDEKVDKFLIDHQKAIRTACKVARIAVPIITIVILSDQVGTVLGQFNDGSGIWVDPTPPPPPTSTPTPTPTPSEIVEGIKTGFNMAYASGAATIGVLGAVGAIGYKYLKSKAAKAVQGAGRVAKGAVGKQSAQPDQTNV